MKIVYNAYKLRLKGYINFVFETIPQFILRSVVENELKSLSCLFKKIKYINNIMQIIG